MYKDFAYVYDRLMSDINVSDWADYVERFIRPKFPDFCSVVDLGCGTGSFCIEMHKRGYSMTGIDSSVDMLSCAITKAHDEGLGNNDILFLNQTMWDINLYGTADIFVSLVDSINYVTDPKKLLSVFKLVHNYLNPGGMFIFDINSKYKFENILANNVFHYVSDDISYIWENRYSSKTGICTYDLTFFVNAGDNLYHRFDEVHKEKAYSQENIVEMALESGFKISGIFDALKTVPPVKESERIFFVLTK